MLETIGVSTVEELFSGVPSDCRLRSAMDVPEGMAECEVLERCSSLASANVDTTRIASFAGGGSYHHFIPSAVDQLLLRSEFYTAYTPYQPEVSQGTLQAVFEFQTMVARLLGMDLSNASLYDGSTALAEATLMCGRVFKGKRSRVVFAGAIHPEYLAVVRTSIEDPDRDMVVVPPGSDGRLDQEALRLALDDTVAGVVVQYPNFFGLLEDVQAARTLSSAVGALLVVSFTEPVAFGLLKAPGGFGADIVVGEGQSLGMPPSFGGPYLGLLACKKEFVRSVPGRLVGQTVDRNGNRCFVITLATREQHIRRAKATSNICTNQGLCALASSIYMSLLGANGFAKLSTLNHQAAVTVRKALSSVPGVTFPHADVPFFNEFVVQVPGSAASLVDRMAAEGVVPGVALSRFPGMPENQLLVTATELTSREHIQRYIEVLGRVGLG
jgi:glycine dehydrogenase subunit 1